MPGFLIQQGASVTCVHGGQAIATVPSPSVTLDGMPAAVISDPWTVAGCTGVPSAVPPCVTAQWTVGSVRVTSFGQPLVIDSGVAQCAPTGTPLLPIVTQVRVTAT
jgi:uncharacterized Zn-binding protein involved in type VI secretion